MRKHLTASLTACLLSASLAGCGEKSKEVQVSEQLDVLLDQMGRLQHADAPIEGNKLEYTLGKEVNGVKVPGSTRFEAAYLDQALALMPMAEQIKNEGTDRQKHAANAIIGSVKTDEAAFLIDEAERAFQQGINDIVALRSKIGVLRDIQALNGTVGGDGTEVIETYQTGLSVGGLKINGIDALEGQASDAASVATKANADLKDYSQQIDELLEKVAEYEALELKLTGQARSAQSDDKFDKLDQATAAAKEAALAQAQAQKLQIDAWIAERAASLAEFKRQQLDGQPQSSITSLLGKLDGLLKEASVETNIPESSDTYSVLAQSLAQAKASTSDDALKSAACLLVISDYGTAPAVDGDQRKLLVAAIDKRVNDYLGVIGVLEMKIAQIKLERQRVADKLAEIDRNRQAVLDELTAGFNQLDAMIQAAGFERMASAMNSLNQAEEAVKGSGTGTDLELMSVYLLKARALQQQSVSAQLYSTTLSSMAVVGPELLGGLHDKLVARNTQMQSLLASVTAAANDLQTAASTVQVNADAESRRGQIAARQQEVYKSLISSMGSGDASAPATQ